MTEKKPYLLTRSHTLSREWSTIKRKEVLLMAVPFLLAVSALYLNIAGFGIITLSGHSMEPTFYPSDMAFCTPEQSYTKGDVAVFRNEETETLVGHRIIYEEEPFHKTSGDNNDHNDSYDKFKKDEDFRCRMEVILHTSREGEGFINLNP